ncbi:MAG: hypothetical protein Kow0056_08360 [Coriobacteriia bacterium]
MQGFVANTDYDWYTYLTDLPDVDEVNFWQPSGGRQFRAVSPGAPFFFRLKSPHNAIAGFGYFARFSILPAWLAWDAFGDKNGAPDFETMLEKVCGYRQRFRTEEAGDPRDISIGCIMVAEPQFFPRDLWVLEPRDWSSNIVSGKGYDLTQGEGRRIYEECTERAQAGLTAEALLRHGQEQQLRYGSPVEVAPRLGQGIFRVYVLDAYDRACAITEEHSLPALDAAHIVPFSEGGSHNVRNGIALRCDIHRLFDQGYVGISPEYTFMVSDALREDYHNGRSYCGFEGERIHLPEDQTLWPDREALDWHSREVFKR